MTTRTNQKEALNQPDWHWADVIAACKRRGWSMRQIALAEGYTAGQAITRAARKPSPKIEAIIARYAGVSHPSEIWPSRYDRSGRPNRKVGPTPQRGLPPLKSTSAPAGCNPQKEAA